MNQPKLIAIILTIGYLLFGAAVAEYATVFGKMVALPCILVVLVDTWYRYGKYAGVVEHLESNRKLDKLLERNKRG